MANSFQQAQQDALSLIKAIEVQLDNLDKKLLESANKLSQMLKMGGVGQNQNQIKAITDEFDRLNKIIAQQNQQLNNLNQTKKTYNSLTQKEKVDIQAINKEKKLEAQSTSKLAGAYANLNAKRLQARKRLRDLIVEQGKNSKEVKKAQREYDKLTRKVNQANKATSNFSNTSLGKLTKGFRNLIGGFGLVLGIQLLGDFTRAVFNNIKELDKLDYTLKTVTESESELARTRAFLNDISIRYGAQIVSTTERYTKFMVAAKQSGLALKETEAIFETMTKASAVLGLKTHELEGVYLALEQMLSKGKVTTEELRRQLGERLPGAFGIMANALGVTTVELDKMLKKGEVLSKDALPLFRKELEKSLGLKQVQTVVTLQTSWTNLSNSWLILLDNLRTGQSWISNVLIFTFQNLAKTVRDLGDLFVSDDQKKFSQNLSNTFKELQDGNVTLEKAEKSLSNFYDIQRKAMEINDYERFGVDKIALEATIKAYEDYINTLKKSEQAQSNEIDNRRELADVMADLKKANDDLMTSTDAEAPAILDRIDALNKEKEAWERRNKAAKESIEPYQNESSKKAMEEQLSNLKEMQSRLDPLSYAYGALELPIKTLETALKGLNGEFENQKDVLEELQPELEGFEEMMNEAISTIKGLREESDDFLKDFTSGFLSDIGFDFLGKVFQDFEKLKEMLDASEDDWAIWAVSIMETAQEAFNFFNQQSQARFDKEYENLEREKEIAILFSGESATAREEIERQYEEKKQDIRRREAREQKKMAIFNATIDTAQAVVAALAIGPPQGFVFAAIAAALGAAQIAMISSTPEPSFFRGTMNAPEGWANVDEKRPEVHTDRQGRIKSFGEGKANKRWLEAGDRIYTSREEYFKRELGDVLSTNDIVPYTQMFDVPNVHIEQGMTANDLRREIKGLKDTIRDVEPVNISVNKSGVSTNIGRTEILNNQLRIKRRRV